MSAEEARDQVDALLADALRMSVRLELRFCVCMAILLMRNTGRPAGSSAKGISEPKGNPGCRRDIVDSVPTETSEARVRMRSAWPGSGTGVMPGRWKRDGAQRQILVQTWNSF